MRARGRALGPFCHALNVTDNQGATLHLSLACGARAPCSRLGCEPIFQQTCRDRNRLALQSDLLAAWTLGLENVLVVTGDDPRSGDHRKAKGVFDLDSTQLLEVARRHERGRRHERHARWTAARTSSSAGRCSPRPSRGRSSCERADQKIEAGARFFQTQAVIDIEKFARAAEALTPTGVKLIAGILLLKSPRVIELHQRAARGARWCPSTSPSASAARRKPLAEAVELADRAGRGRAGRSPTACTSCRSVWTRRFPASSSARG